MLHKDQMWFFGLFRIVVRCLVLFSSGIPCIAMAQNPVPVINQPLVPDTKIPGSAGFTLTVNGTDLVSGATVHWNGSPRTTTFVNKSRLKATILASDVAAAGTAWITVVNPSPGGGVSNTVFFPVTLSVNFSVSESTFPAGTGPDYLATADFNNDGNLDIVVPDPGSGNVSVLLGNGDGTFQTPTVYTVGAQVSPEFFDVAVGDFDGDGNLDFVVSDSQHNYVSVFIGNGDGTFKPGVTYAVGTNPSSVAVADVNGDGKLDLAVSNQNCTNGGPPCGTGTISILLGNGDGTFQTQSQFNAGKCANGVVVGDFNGDDKLDLAVVNGNCGGGSNSALLSLLGNGEGTFQLTGSYPLNTNGASLGTADFNGDGKLDIAIADNIGVMSILIGNGDGTFQPRVDYAAGSFPLGLAIGDFNEDGRLDVALVNSGGNNLSIFFGNGDGTFQPQIAQAVGAFPHGVTAGDFNHDGRLDLAVANANDNTVSILVQDGTVAISPPDLNFGVQVVGAGHTKEVTLTNLGTTVLTVSIAVSGTNATDFSQSNTCAGSVGAGAHCTISVAFTPAQLGPASAALTITDSAAGSPQSVPLTGIGGISGPNATLSTAALSFGTLLVGTTSAATVVTLSNYGTRTLSIAGISSSGPFSQTHDCGATLASGASCAIAVSFAPKAKGNLGGALSITDNAPGSPQTVSLSGVGTVVELGSGGLNFGTIRVGTETTRSTTLTNVGKVAISISSITMTGPYFSFSSSNTCTFPSSLGAGMSCTIGVAFSPAEAGTFTGTVTISDNGGGSPQQVSLLGAGCVYNPLKHKCIAAVSNLAVQSALAKSQTKTVPSVTGSSKIGTRVLDLVDSSRTDPFAANGTQRDLLVRFWYPAAALQRTCNLAEYTSPRVWNYFSELTGLPLPGVTTNSCLNAPVAKGAHPVVVFTHGYTGTFTDYTFLFEDLASRGYVVASIDHTYEATALEFPDGRFVKSVLGSHLANTWQTDEQSLSFALSVRLGDLTFVLNELERLNASPESPFVGKLDMARVALAGHSLGGLTTWFGLQLDARFKTGILLDPYLADISLGQTDTPVVLLTMGHEQQDEDECQLWSDLLGPRFSVNLRGAEHLTASDAVWLARGAIKTGAMGPDKTIAALRDYVAAFLDANLLGKPADRLLTGPSLAYPDAVVTTQDGAFCSRK